jgi:hypothetical protein
MYTNQNSVRNQSAERRASAPDTRSASIEATLSDLWTQRSIRPGSTYNARLMSLHTARRCLMVRIEDALRDGLPTDALEAELNVNKSETRAFLAFLHFDAHARP